MTSSDLAGSAVGRLTSLPRWKVAPARTRATRFGAFTVRHRDCAALITLNAIARPAAREPGPLVTLLRCRMVAKVDSMGQPGAIAEELLQRRPEVPAGHPVQIQQRQHVGDLRRLPCPRRQDPRRETLSLTGLLIDREWCRRRQVGPRGTRSRCRSRTRACKGCLPRRPL